MLLADRIIELRKKNGWSQEELAEKVDVTRQSVSKWESAQSVPDLDRILKLAEVFGVTTDYLLKDTKNAEEEKVKEEKTGNAENGVSENTRRRGYDEIPERKLTLGEVRGFLKVKEETAPKIASAVSMCILSPIILILLCGAAEYGIIDADEDRMAMLGVIVLIAIVAAAVSIIISAVFKSSKYEYLEKEPISLDSEAEAMVKDLKNEYEPEFGRKITFGVCLSVLSVIPMFIAGVILDPDDGFHFVAASAILLAIVAFAVNIFVKAGIRHESYQKLLEEGDYTREEKDKGLETVSSIYWLCVTAIYLAYSFITFRWHTSWIIWPVAGVVFMIVREVYKAAKRS